MRRFLCSLSLGVGLSACTTETESICVPAKETALFGRPNDKTGLSADQCAPTCGDCEEQWEEEPWTPARVETLRDWKLETPLGELTVDPYQSPAAPVEEGAVCAVLVTDAALRTYHLETYPSATDAESAGATVTHGDACGLCSTLQDLAVYAETLDLTDPVRACGIANLDDHEGLVACIEALGFSLPCAQVWAYNTEHTRDVCLDVCLELLGKPYHEENGDLNACLRCDEEESGAVFKAVAGRTRRNTGIASAMCRPCDEVYRLEHAY